MNGYEHSLVITSDYDGNVLNINICNWRKKKILQCGMVISEGVPLGFSSVGSGEQ